MPVVIYSGKRKCACGVTNPGMLWVDRVGDRRSWAILVRNFFVENEKLTKFREHLSQNR